MLLVDRLVEEKINIAVRQGDFDNLPGEGQPLVMEDTSAIPAELRAGYRILKNAGFLPPELQLRNEIRQLEDLLNRVEMEGEQTSIRRRLCLLRARLAARGHESSLLLGESEYRTRVIEKIAHDGSCKGIGS